MKAIGKRRLCTVGIRSVLTPAAAALCLVLAGDSSAELRHNYLFNSGDGTTIVDSQSGANGTAVGGTITTADSRFAMDGVDDYGDLPGASIGVNAYSELTFELWSAVSTVHEGQFTASVAFGATDEGGVGQNYVMMQPTRGGAQGSSGQIKTPLNGPEILIAGENDLSDGRVHHTVVTVTETELAYYVDGQQIGTQALDPGTTSLADVSTDFAYLGQSVWGADPLLTAALYEFRIYDDAKDATAVADLYNAGCQDACGNIFLRIDRDTGAATLSNSLSARNIVISEISSPSGALDPDMWTSIAGNYDSSSTGDGSVDPDDMWERTSETKTLLSELDPIGEGDDDGAVFDSDIDLGNMWTKSPYEDVQVTLTILDESFIEQEIPVAVLFEGNGGEPFSRSDFDLDGDIDEDDYLTLRGNHLAGLEGELPIDTFAFGDINGDLVNDYRDFRLFKDDYIAANSEEAFASMVARFGAVPEPGALGMLLLGAAGGVLAIRRRRSEPGLQLAQPRSGSNQPCSAMGATMSCLYTILIPIALLALSPTATRAQVVVGSQNFDDLTVGDLTGSGLAGGRYFVCCGATAGSEFGEIVTPGVGGSGNMVQAGHEHNAGGFSLGGFGFDMPLEGNISPNRLDYVLEFDMRIVEGQPYAETPLDFFITIVDTPVFGGNEDHGSVYNFTGVDVLEVGGDFQRISMNLGDPSGMFFNRDEHWKPVDPNGNNSISFEFNSQGVPTEEMGTFTQSIEIDNVELILDIATSLALQVNDTSGEASIRNVSDADVTFDYYRIESTNGALLTSDFDGGAGWDSLSDQGFDSVGDGFGEAWDEIVETNSANRIAEQFLLGETTLSPNEAVSIGAPVDPAILAGQLDTLSLRFGGPGFDAEGFGEVTAPPARSAGDYNDDGVVDARDYALWRDNLGQDGNVLANRDPGATGVVGAADYDAWVANYGATGAAADNAAAAPEPAAGALCGLVFGLVAGGSSRWRRG